VPPPSTGLRPEPGERGLASGHPDEVAALLSGAWGAMLDLAVRVDLDAPSRLRGWSARDVLVHLGSWDEVATPLEERADDARTGRVRSEDDADARNAMVVTAHHDAGLDEITTALRAGRDRALSFLQSPDVEVVGPRWVDSKMGQLPMTGVLVAQAYELAVHAIDLLAPVPDQVPDALLDAGTGALVDVAGALAARHGVTETFAVLTPAGCWATGTTDGAWTTLRLAPGVQASALGWPAVAGSAQDVLDASAGRAIAVQLLATRRLRVHGVPGLLRLLPALGSVPGFPSGPALQATLRALSQTGRMAGRLGCGIAGALTRR
jgi:uncharacterized protein (TIGR03083 family)